MYIPHSESQKNISVGMYITHNQSKEFVSVLMYIPHSQSRKNVSVRMYIPHGFMCRLVCERCNYHTRSALVNCLLYQLYHTRFDEENCVALGYPSQALLLLEPFAKIHDTFSRFISLQLIIPVLQKFSFHIEQLFANFISGT